MPGWGWVEDPGVAPSRTQHQAAESSSSLLLEASCSLAGGLLQQGPTAHPFVTGPGMALLQKDAP
eukprot:NODE_11532_length_406_cov_11.179272_g10396_i0.p1 GENE.NODE_11532_length_406_cov_11.179272_g10396_i0~~NODE_11532_length_406_cov_11.179272_g10396_i0.p1  ORF type:complete len:65 (+),score=4.79 NODE_11532_length_406_cov_11.179272_g10396_i0:79-273(+)